MQGHAVNSSQMLHLYFWYPRSYTKLRGRVQKFFFEDDSYDFQTEISWILDNLTFIQSRRSTMYITYLKTTRNIWSMCFVFMEAEDKKTEMSEVFLKHPVFMMLQFWRKNKQLFWWWPPNRIYTRVWCGMFASNLKRSMCRIYGFYLKWYERI